MNCLKRAKEIEDVIINDRRQLHKIPELQLSLPKTVAYVENELKKLDISYKKLVNGNAIVAEIGDYKGKCIAIRADMDALPIKEETSLSFCSTHEGKMHACGHDGHTAMALGACRILKENEKDLDGLVKIFFQPGEEIPGGAKPMIDEGCMENPKVDRVIGLHEGGIFGHLPTGTVGYKEDAMMASMDAFILKVKGHGGHGARPENFIDPIITISEINLALQKIISRELDPTKSALISICQIHGGTCQNIIPDEVWEEGTVRTLDEDVRDFVEKRMKEVSENIAKAFRCEAELDYKRYYPAVINDKEFTAYVKNIAQEILGDDKVIEISRPTMGGEDFAFFEKEARGTFLSLNNLKANKDGKVYPHHNSKFDVDESAFYIGSGLMAEVAYRYLKEGSKWKNINFIL